MSDYLFSVRSFCSFVHFPALFPYDFVFSCAGGSVFDIFDEETRNQPGTSAASKKIQGNDRNDELLRTTDRIQVSDGNIVQESVPASNDRKDELLRTDGRIQVSDGNRLQDSVPASQQNEVKLLITSTKEESLTIETDLKSDMAILNKDPGNVSSMTCPLLRRVY